MNLRKVLLVPLACTVLSLSLAVASPGGASSGASQEAPSSPGSGLLEGVVTLRPPAGFAGQPTVAIAPQVASATATQTAARARVSLRGLRPDDFQHPWDAAALRVLKKAKGFDWLTAKMLELGPERYMAVSNIATRVQISDRQFPQLYNLLKDAAYTLDVPMPQLFLELGPYPNAYTSGAKAPFIVVNSALIDLMDNDEISFVLGHELGHIKSNHVLYGLLASNIGAILRAIGQATLGVGELVGKGLDALLQDWSRKAELSADRAGLLVVQDPDVAIRVMMKLAGGFSPRTYGSLNKEAFLDQAQEYSAMRGDALTAVYQAAQTVGESHPWPVLRASEIDKWSKGQECLDILKEYGRPL